jgi:hypothetical protein
MSQIRDSHTDNLISQQPAPAGAEEFAERIHGLLDGQPKDEETVQQAFAGMDSMFEMIAAGLYNLGSMLVGEGEDSVRLVETAVATAKISANDDALQARKSIRLVLARAAIALLLQRTPGSLDTPGGLEHVSTCIADDDLDNASASGEEFQKMMAGPDRGRVRSWLGSLAVEQRVIFVLRAVAGFTSAETAELLVKQGGEKASGWNAQAVREIFRQALCSLASQLIHESTTY